MKRILFLSTGNSCRSQMAEGMVNNDMEARIEVYSAGTEATPTRSVRSSSAE